MVFQIIYEQNLERCKSGPKATRWGTVQLIERTFLRDQGIIRIANSSILRFYNIRSQHFSEFYIETIVEISVYAMNTLSIE